MKFMDKLFYLSIGIIVLLVVRNMYNERRRQQLSMGISTNNVDDYFYRNNIVLQSLKREKIWIHIPFERNSRVWDDFGSRSSHDLNIAYVYLCLKNVIDKCGLMYDVIIYDDSNIPDILEEDCECDDVDKLSGVLLEKFREISKCKIINKYGGVQIPCSLFIKECPTNLFKVKELTVCELPNEGLNKSLKEYVISNKYIGSRKNNPLLAEYIKHLKALDYSVENTKFKVDEYLKENAKILCPSFFGNMDVRGKPIYIEQMFQNSHVELRENHIGVYLNLDEVMKRSHYQWFLKMSMEQVLESNTFIGTYMSENM